MHHIRTLLVLLSALIATTSQAETLLSCHFDTFIDSRVFDVVGFKIVSDANSNQFKTITTYRYPTVQPETTSAPMSRAEAESQLQKGFLLAAIADDGRKLPVIYNTLVSIQKSSDGKIGLVTNVQDWDGSKWVSESDQASIDAQVAHCE